MGVFLSLPTLNIKVRGYSLLITIFIPPPQLLIVGTSKGLSTLLYIFFCFCCSDATISFVGEFASVCEGEVDREVCLEISDVDLACDIEVTLNFTGVSACKY